MRLIDVYADANHFELVTEFCEGKDLFEYIKANGKLNEKEAARILKQLLMAINYCHERNICHRDMKVENIVVDE
jgi:serine/threonine protein kinase